MRFIILLSSFLMLFGLTKAQSNKELKSDIESVKTQNELLKAKVESLESKLQLLQNEFNTFKSEQIKQSQPAEVKSIESGKSGNTTKETQTTPATNGQCKATTQKGTRCSRSAKSNGYCYQHGGN